jgi:adenylate cyclase
LLRQGVPIGAIALTRSTVRPFTAKQIELLEIFADQAVIAIENVRLFEGEQQRTRELSESLEQQTATSEVLSVISSSPGELPPVFHAMLENATRICEASFGNLLLREGDTFRRVATHNAPPNFATFIAKEPLIHRRQSGSLNRLIETKQADHVADMAVDEPETPIVKFGGARTLVAVPMLKENEFIGVFAIYRQEVRPFTDKQIELVKNFAAQAVIAIENARLLNELRESLDQQTATSEVLRVISSSPGDLEPVFEAMLQNSVRICEAGFGQMFLCQGDNVRHVATIGVPTTLVEFDKRRGTFQPSPGGGLDQAMRTKQVVHIADLTSEHASYPPARLGGARSYIAVPMLREGELVGAIAIYRQEVRPFTDRQIALVTNFAAQAVIAIENTRLLNELRERTAQLEARSHEIAKLNAQLEQRVADQVGEIERMSRLRRFLPPQVADLIVASGGERQLESHRREITALFCDLRGFTGFSESSDPEDVMTLLRQYHAAIGAIIIKYSGTLERYAGDGVMVVFNDPVPVDNPALQAVRMALDMRAALGALIEKWRRLGHELGFGIGIAHGYATLGTIGFEGRFDYAAIGTVSNVASRLCDEAKPGQILISSRVLMAVEEAIAVESVGDFALKGISRPLAAYNVVGVK